MNFQINNRHNKYYINKYIYINIYIKYYQKAISIQPCERTLSEYKMTTLETS